MSSAGDSVTGAHDLVTLGEVLLRLAVPSPGRIETARQLDVQIGGAEANVAAAGARLGLSTAWVSALPANAWGERVRHELAGHGIDCAYVRMLEDARMGLYFLEYGVPPRPIRVLYDRRDSALARLAVDEVDWEPVRRARLVHLTGITPALGPRPRALVERAAREASAVSFDVNYRATLWSPEEARAFLDTVVPTVRYLFLGEEEARRVFKLDGTAEGMLEAVARLAPQATVTMLRGEAGSLTLDAGRFVRPARRHTVQVVDPIGAGDAYVAGFLWARLGERSVEDAVEAGNAVAALKCSTWGDIALVTRRDVEEVLAGGPSVRR
jgi:2-dehydro-3-deoxygluconokinase